MARLSSREIRLPSSQQAVKTGQPGKADSPGEEKKEKKKEKREKERNRLKNEE